MGGGRRRRWLGVVLPMVAAGAGRYHPRALANVLRKPFAPLEVAAKRRGSDWSRPANAVGAGVGS